MRASVLLVLLLAVSTVQLPAQAAPSLPDIEDEVMCPVCGTPLSVSNGPQAERERELIRSLIDQGKSKQQIKDQLVEEYGEEVLATPSGEGFNITVYIVPIILLLTAGAVVSVSAHRWRRPTQQVDTPDLELSPSDQERLDQELTSSEDS